MRGGHHLGYFARVEAWHRLRITTPLEEAFARRMITSREECISGDDAGKPIFGFGGHSQPDKAAPVLTHQGNALQVEGFDEGVHPVHVALVSVIGATRKLV